MRALGLCCLVGMLAMAPPTLAAETITVDASTVDGVIPAIHGVNNGPIVSTDPAWEPPCGNNYDADYSQEFMDANIPQARTHGGGPLDVTKIWANWPDYDSVAHPATDGASYNWTVSDAGVAAQIAAGAEPYIRIGPPANSEIAAGQGCDNSMPTNIMPPEEDWDNVAEMFKRIMMHYTAGWDNGFYYDINFLEVWNEFYVGNYWSGTDTEAARFYEKIYNAVHSEFPDLNIGPSASRGMNDFWVYVAQNNVGMEFVAPHSYMTRPRSLNSVVYEKNQENWEYLFGQVGMPTDTPLVFSEWNRGGGCYNAGGGSDSVPVGAFVAASLITMAELHPSNGTPNDTHALVMGHFFSARYQIWKADGTPRSGGVGLEAYGRDLYGETPIKLASTGDHSDPIVQGNPGYVDFKVMAGKSADESKINVLVSYYDVTNGTCPDNTDTGTVIPLAVDINNLPWGTAAFTWERWAHTLPGEMTLEDSGSGSGGSFSTSQNMNGNVFELYKLVGPASSGLPGQATNPSPADGATGVSLTAQTSWTAATGATSYDVWAGFTNPPTQFQGNQTGTTYDPGTLLPSTTYYTRVDSVNAVGTTTGTVWSFTTGSAGMLIRLL